MGVGGEGGEGARRNKDGREAEEEEERKAGSGGMQGVWRRGGGWGMGRLSKHGTSHRERIHSLFHVLLRPSVRLPYGPSALRRDAEQDFRGVRG